MKAKPVKAKRELEKLKKAMDIVSNLLEGRISESAIQRLPADTQRNIAFIFEILIVNTQGKNKPVSVH